MGRTAVIKLINNTGYALSLVAQKTMHGKFTVNPPQTINDSSATFTVANSDGALIGPKGQLVYSIADSSGTGQSLGNITIFWNHPFSGATSVYTGTPDNSAAKYVTVSSASVVGGHDQTVTLTAQSA